MKEKMYGGRKPFEDDGWRLEKKIADENEQSWLVFSKPQEHSNEWVTFKIVADGRVPKKANYWVVKNLKTRQIAFPADMAMMREHRKVLHEKVEQFFLSKIV